MNLSESMNQLWLFSYLTIAKETCRAVEIRNMNHYVPTFFSRSLQKLGYEKIGTREGKQVRKPQLFPHPARPPLLTPLLGLHHRILEPGGHCQLPVPSLPHRTSSSSIIRLLHPVLNTLLLPILPSHSTAPNLLHLHGPVSEYLNDSQD